MCFVLKFVASVVKVDICCSASARWRVIIDGMEVVPSGGKFVIVCEVVVKAEEEFLAFTDWRYCAEVPRVIVVLCFEILPQQVE